MSQGFASHKETTKAGQSKPPLGAATDAAGTLPGFLLALIQSKPPLGAATDAASIQEQWEAHFAELQDPRGRQGVEHPFLGVA
ncbi:hypothetical protein [Phormidium sp. FACHB-1136]|uniref:hypothetical protein n=1 Tax=Phormidium sp. FACHB-1136 TaxID=2692848 RepID=UPI0018EFAA05|nr:hypothetical protein [Phormidium sp. FACHB-1136]